MTLFRRTRLPSPPPAAEELPPRPQSPASPCSGSVRAARWSPPAPAAPTTTRAGPAR